MAGPPTPAEKITVVAEKVFGRMGVPSSNIPRLVIPYLVDATEEPTAARFRRAKRQAECQDPIDLAILMDSSGSVSRSDFSQAVSDVATLIYYTCNDFSCNDGPRIRLAMVTFSSHATTVFNFDRSKQFTNVTDMVMAISKTRTSYLGDMTATAAAIKYVSDYIFNTRYGMRPSSTKRLIVVTDGKNNGGGNPSREAENLHNAKKVDVYAIGIGNKISEAEIRELSFFKSEDTKRDYLLPYFIFNTGREFSDGVKLIVRVVTNNLDPKKCSKISVKK